MKNKLLHARRRHLSSKGGLRGGRPAVYARPPIRKSIAFLAPAADQIELLAEKLGVSYADVLHLSLLSLSHDHGLDTTKLQQVILHKATVMGHDSLKAAIPPTNAVLKSAGIPQQDTLPQLPAP